MELEVSVRAVRENGEVLAQREAEFPYLSSGVDVFHLHEGIGKVASAMTIGVRDDLLDVAKELMAVMPEVQPKPVSVQQARVKLPNWETAPAEARYHAVDASRIGHYFAEMPERYHAHWHSYGKSWTTDYSVELSGLDWSDTLEARPQLFAIPFDWSDAPEGMNFRALDDDGSLYYYEREPAPLGMSVWWPAPESKSRKSNRVADMTDIDWRKTLEKRPAGKVAPKFSGPDWSNAPKDAMFWAADMSGVAYFYKEEPKRGDHHWWPPESSSMMENDKDFKAPAGFDWTNSLHRRPHEQVYSEPDWEGVDEKWMFWAVDRNLRAFYYETEPAILSIEWMCGRDGGNAMKDQHKIELQGDWRNSLHKRPTMKLPE